MTHTNETFCRYNPLHTIQLSAGPRDLYYYSSSYFKLTVLSLCSGIYTSVTTVTIIWDYEVLQLLRAVAFMS